MTKKQIYFTPLAWEDIVIGSVVADLKSSVWSEKNICFYVALYKNEDFDGKWITWLTFHNNHMLTFTYRDWFLSGVEKIA